MTSFDGGSPVSSPNNPFSNGAPFQDGPQIDDMPAVNAARDNLDGYGSIPPRGDVQRPENPPTSDS